MVARVLIENKLLDRDIKNLIKDYPFALSRTMQLTVRKCRDELRREMSGKFENPRRSTINNVSMRFPSASQIRRGDAAAFVFVREPLLDAIHPQVLGGKVTQTAGTSSGASGTDGFVITPVNVRLNKFGNIPALRRRLAKWRADKSRYLEVPLDNTDPRTRHLTPGMYERKRRRRRRSGRRRRRNNSNGESSSLILLVLYSRERDYKAILPYHDTIIRCYERWFPRVLLAATRKYGRN
jgi:hypothetical protein